MAFRWDVGRSINMAEFDFALMLMKSSLEIEKVFDNERSTKSWWNRLWNDFWMNPTINLNANTFDLLWHLARATKWKMQLASCDWDIEHALPIGKHSLTRVSWDTWHTLPIGKRSLTRVGCIQDLISNRQMQQPTEMWKKACRWRMKRCIFPTCCCLSWILRYSEGYPGF